MRSVHGALERRIPVVAVFKLLCSIKLLCGGEKALPCDMETVPQRGGLLLLYVRSGRHKENMERRQPHRLVQMSWQRGIALSLLALAVSARAQTQPEGLNLKQTLLVPTTALTPPMGWNSWNFFEAKIDDAAIRREADALVSSGMRDAGYVYVNVDDGWQGKRDAQGFIHGNSRWGRTCIRKD
jgi:hypothetical protein